LQVLVATAGKTLQFALAMGKAYAASSPAPREPIKPGFSRWMGILPAPYTDFRCKISLLR
jgi:hypothetical protein